MSTFQLPAILKREKLSLRVNLMTPYSRSTFPTDHTGGKELFNIARAVLH
jgi:hypothetical protein